MMDWCEAHYGEASACWMQKQQGMSLLAATNPDPQCANAPLMDHLLPNWNSNGYILPFKNGYVLILWIYPIK